jgi:hypothetical protein
MKRTVLLLLIAVLAAGCGAAGKEANTGAAGGTRGELFGDEGNVEGHTAAYRAALINCDLYPLKELARQSGVKATPEAVAEAYSKAEPTPKEQAEAKKGCLAALNRRN